MVVDESISQALNRIADAIEESNDTLKSILGHYNSVVPVMKRNADKAEEHMEKADDSIVERAKDLFRPVTN